MKPWLRAIALAAPALALGGAPSQAQMIDNTQATNPIKAGINKSLSDEVGTGRGNVNVVGSSAYIIARDPFRSIRRGRQLFQRKFTNLQGQGPNEKDGIGDIALDKGIGAGLSDSCASCHGRPRGSVPSPRRIEGHEKRGAHPAAMPLLGPVGVTTPRSTGSNTANSSGECPSPR